MAKKKKKKLGLRKKKVADSYPGAETKEEKSDAGGKIAPHFDTQERNSEPNTDVEVAKGTLGDSFQTDSRPKETN